MGGMLDSGMHTELERVCFELEVGVEYSACHTIEV